MHSIVGTGVPDGPKGNAFSCLCGYNYMNGCYNGLQFYAYCKFFVLGPSRTPVPTIECICISKNTFLILLYHTMAE